MSWAGPFQYALGKSNQASAAAPIDYAADAPTLLCLSHLRWSFVYQRPQHLMARFARDWRVLFFEEPMADAGGEPWLESRHEEGVQVLVPHLPADCRGPAAAAALRRLLDEHLAAQRPRRLILWYYTPMALAYSDHLTAEAVVYDCMDELSAFRGAPPELVEREAELLARADLLFTGGYSLWEAKRQRHANAHPFPSSVDIAHFAAARTPQADPPDQATLARPRLGFYGVIDERLDLELLDALAARRPDWQLVMLGPVVKIDPASLPRRPNLHFLGGKVYDELPRYLAGWDVALMPFALNESTRFISPTKTPEYLAGGRPVVSTPIADVVRSYGDSGLVRIAAGADPFVAACEAALRDSADRERLLERADALLADMSWDTTWAQMREKIACTMNRTAAGAASARVSTT
ncbi:glycosyltransferase family 1 protein [Azotobacter salinestris]|uniref:glycosyltransferase family 1 protein n=1 Tax=Azotobacter salinestris TaxID=69964 RepID=UPI001266A177|nr:glycosyltransferase family 1 protein [Azotobacter salinestris]